VKRTCPPIFVAEIYPPGGSRSIGIPLNLTLFNQSVAYV
jgi:hypothetical protein